MLAARDTAAAELVDRSLETSEEIQRLRAAEAEMSADTRAYFITAREPFLARARSSLQALESSQHKLLDLTADGAVGQQRMVRIGAIEQAREERMFGGIARFRSGAFRVGSVARRIAPAGKRTAADREPAEVHGRRQRPPDQVVARAGSVGARRVRGCHWRGHVLRTARRRRDDAAFCARH